jgi:hypothetical protein
MTLGQAMAGRHALSGLPFAFCYLLSDQVGEPAVAGRVPGAPISRWRTLSAVLTCTRAGPP